MSSDELALTVILVAVIMMAPTLIDLIREAIRTYDKDE
jgi:hypothetical protein